MIPDDLRWALEDGRTFQTDGGSGTAVVRRLADLVLPTGRILLGLPGSPLLNEPSPIQPEFSPGRYPVFASVLDLPGGYRELAFVVVCFQDGPPTTWSEVGSFFTDSGCGCLMDVASATLLDRFFARAEETNPEFVRMWLEKKMGVFADGDCSLTLDETTSANAIIFQTHDSCYPCFLGLDTHGRPAWLVVDCR
jgi:hypothetical protein